MATNAGVVWTDGPRPTFRVTDRTLVRPWPGKYVLYDQTQQEVALSGRVFASYDEAADEAADRSLRECCPVRLEGVS
jgi:hypothetical protein